MPRPSIRFRVLPAPKLPGEPFIFSPNGKLLATPTRHSIKLYDSATGALVAELVPQDRWRKDWIGFLNFSADSQMLTASTSGDERIRAWDVKTLEQKALITDLSIMDFNKPVGHLIVRAARDGKTVKIWDIRTGQMHKTIPGERRPYAMEISPDGKTLIISSFLDINIYDMTSWERKANLKKLRTDSSPVIDFTFSPDSQLVAMVGFSSIVTIQDMETYEIKTRLTGHKKQIEQVVFSPDGELLVTTSSDKTTKLWEVETGQLKATLTEKNGAVRFASFSPDGRLLATSGTKREKVELMDVATLAVKAEIDSKREAHFAFNPDGRSIAVSSKDESVTVWDISNIR